MTSFQLQQSNGQSGIASTYQYYSDGQLKFSHSRDDRFDRAYSYDQAARIKRAFIGKRHDLRRKKDKPPVAALQPGRATPTVSTQTDRPDP